MSNSSSYAVEAHDLVKVFPRGNVRALDGVSLQVEEGTILGLLGPNGAGKTTAVRILSTILGPDSGHASILGHDVVKEAETVRRIIGLAGQYAAVDENLTGAENIRMVGRLSHMSRRDARSRAVDLLDGFGLTDAGDRVLKTYSGGMRRRLDLAAALVARPPVLFLDEPTTGLDPQSRQDLWGVIEDLVAGGTTVLLTTQYLEEADRLARNIVVVDHGQVIAEGTPAALKANLGTSVVSITLSDGEAANKAAALVASFSTKAPTVDHNIVELTVEDGPKVGADVLRTLDAAQVPIAGLALREPSLDDVFLSLTGHKSEAETEEKRAARIGKGAKRKGTEADTDGRDAA
jgi:ABC-2 type transport system ATP-binding protein